ncbi:hypothetical protein NDU88_004325 [Pleurodeles waltl]|uniref:Uncharacterized protein n=1 Tax=Pleurodeles waltl TaxID=8319 RepID=A0AAV7UF09_PLEWA|nr:hypothetical protein NDU88_004325 [Pleurodeles waltl]
MLQLPGYRPFIPRTRHNGDSSPCHHTSPLMGLDGVKSCGLPVGTGKINTEAKQRSGWRQIMRSPRWYWKNKHRSKTKPQ